MAINWAVLHSGFMVLGFIAEVGIRYVMMEARNRTTESPL